MRDRTWKEETTGLVKRGSSETLGHFRIPHCTVSTGIQSRKGAGWRPSLRAHRL